MRHVVAVEHFGQIDSGAGGYDFGACAEGWGHPCAPRSDLAAVAGAKAELGLDDIFVPRPDDLDHLGTSVLVRFHAAFIATAKLFESAVANEIQQMRVVLPCAVTA
jgi:hypothetical protein